MKKNSLRAAAARGKAPVTGRKKGTWKNKIVFGILLVILLVVSVTACNLFSFRPSGSEEVQKEFDSFVNDIFLSKVQGDSISLNCYLSDPEAFGITDFAPTLGSFSADELRAQLASSENIQAALKNFPYKKLTDEQQLIYDSLKFSYQTDPKSEDFIYYYEALGPTTGLQAQLPILLAEYHFSSSADVEEYLEILPLIYPYFEEIAAFEKEKSEAGLFMSDFAADDIIKQCSGFISSPDSNFLLETFSDRLEGLELTDKEKSGYIKQNKKAVKESVIPAYELLIDTLTELKGTGTNEEGLCHYPLGKEYYTSLVQGSTGSSKSVEEMEKRLEKLLSDSLGQMKEIATADPDVYDEILTSVFPDAKPDELLNELKEACAVNFPGTPQTAIKVNYVHPSLEEYLSPAFYLMTPIDEASEHAIYINGGSDYDAASLFTTLAHEGYPGHLYQDLYFSSQDVSPLRKVMSFGGYSEGWGTYAEMSSYNMAGLKENVAGMLSNNMEATLAVHGITDIGIHYYGWSLKEAEQFLAKFGIKDKDSIERIYKRIVEDPGNYLKYIVGYCEILDLKEQAKKSWSDYSDMKFHTFFLDMGPSPFDAIKKRI
ncbi:DUF885 domain-containing protein [Anaerolentibacter hominis]|uniref:DUF885 domain-containing protein n=1 Tax=Anaerolentibacter hominis TaxID=3079009 RepID=UPI0031B83410